MPHAHPYRLLVGAILVFSGFSAFLIAPASVSPLLVSRYGVDAAAVGAAISVTYAGWLLVQLPSGFLMDRYDNRALLAVAVALFVVAVAGGALVDAYVAFLVARFVAGTAAGILWGVGANVVGQTFPDDRSDVATGVYVASGPLGLAVGQFASPLLAGSVGLRATFPAYAALTLVGFGLFRWARPPSVRSTERIGFARFVRSLLDRPVLLLALSACCGNGAWLFLNAWLPTYGTDVLSLPLASVGALTALGPLAGAVARSSGGVSADRVGRRTTIVGSLLLVAPLVALFPFARSAVGFGLVLLCSGFAIQFAVGVYYVYVQDLMGEGLSGTGISAVTAFQLFGGMVAPVAGGWLVQRASWGAAFAAVAVTVVVGALVVLLVPAARR